MLWLWVPVALAIGFIVWSTCLFFSARSDQTQLHRNVELVSRLHELTRASRELGYVQAADETRWQEHFDKFQRAIAAVREFGQDAASTEPSLVEFENWASNLVLLRGAGRVENDTQARVLTPLVRKLEAVRDAARANSRKTSIDLARKWNQLHVVVGVTCILVIALTVLLQLYRRDMVRRKNTEDQLRLAHDELSQLMASIPDYLWSFNLDPKGRFAYRYISSVVEKIMGRPPEFFMESPERWLSTIHAEDRPRLQAAQRRILGKETTEEEEEYRVVWPDESVHWVRDRAVARMLPCGTLRVDGVVSDITERKRLEEQYLHAQKMEAVGQLAGGVAHDFNNLLTVINGYCDLLLNAEPDNPGREFVQEVQKAGTRATSLTRQLLAFGRRQVLQPIILDLNSVVADTEKMLRRLIGADIELATQPAENLPSVKVDPGQVEQVLMNLAVNARDAMPRGGKFSITTSNVTLARDRERPEIKPGEYVCLCVGDTGCGMDAATQGKIFEPFFTTKPVGKGTGLGLATVYGIVKQSGGYIYVESEVGHGATFTIYLPAVAGAVTMPVELNSLSNLPQATETVLLVEDEESVRKLARQVLELYGYTVLEGKHGGDGLQLARNHAGSIDIVVTDIVMPIIDGAELVRRLRKDRPDIRVLYITGYTESALARRFMSKDDDRLLIKPFHPERFARVVREVLDGNGNGFAARPEEVQGQLVS